MKVIKLLLNVVVILVLMVGALLLVAHLIPLSPIERAIAACTTPDQQPVWAASVRVPHVQTDRYLGYSYYSERGLVERWVARIISATITQQGGGRVTLDFVYTHRVQVEYFGWLGFSYWKTPILSEEEYNSYYSTGQSLLAQWGGDQKWEGVDWVSYYLHFNRNNRLTSVDCPGGAHVDLSQK